MDDRFDHVRIAALLVLAACADDPTLRVEVEHDLAVARTVISVYESDSITCEQIEFGDLDQDQLAALLVAEQTIEANGQVTGNLDGLSRTDPKAVVARGYTSDGTLVNAGCTDKGLVEGHDKVVVHTVPIATVSTTLISDGTNEPYEIGVFTTNAAGNTLARRPISWRVWGPTGTTAVAPAGVTALGDGVWQRTDPVCTRMNGVATIHPVPPSLVGGYAVRVRVKWAAQATPLFSGLAKGDVMPLALQPPAQTKHACAVRTAGGQRRIVCLDRAVLLPQMPPVAREYAVTVTGGSARLAVTDTQMLARAALGVFALTNANGTRDVYAVEPDGTLVALFGAPAPAAITCPECTAVEDFLYAPSCGARDPSPQLLYLVKGAGDVSDKVFALPARGGTASALPLMTDPMKTRLSLNNAGCVTKLDQSGHESRQLAVIDSTRDGETFSLTRGFYNCATGTCTQVVLPVSEAGTGFAAGTEPMLVGTSTDATGVAISSWVLVPDPDTPRLDRLIERDRVPAAGRPHRLATGEFDTDGGIDLIWDLAMMRGSSLELGYSRMAGDQRLVALAAPVGLVPEDLGVLDVTGDGRDDIIVTWRSSLASNAVGVSVIPTHVPPPAITLPSDDLANPCP